MMSQLLELLVGFEILVGTAVKKMKSAYAHRRRLLHRLENIEYAVVSASGEQHAIDQKRQFVAKIVGHKLLRGIADKQIFVAQRQRVSASNIGKNVYVAEHGILFDKHKSRAVFCKIDVTCDGMAKPSHRHIFRAWNPS